MPTSTFVSKGPRIAVFQENKLKKLDEAMDKYYNQDNGTIAEGQLKLSQKRLEQLIYKLRKDSSTGTHISNGTHNSNMNTTAGLESSR